MSVLVMFSIHDSKAEAWQYPFRALARGAGIRMFEAACNDENNDFCKYAGDFTLFEVGTFDEKTGDITPYEVKTNLGLALQYKNQQMIPGTESKPIIELARKESTS